MLNKYIDEETAIALIESYRYNSTLPNVGLDVNMVLSFMADELESVLKEHDE